MKYFFVVVFMINIVISSPKSRAEMDKIAQFTDPNFKLVVMQSLLENKHLDLGEPEKLAEKILKRSVDIESEGYSLNVEIYDYLVSYPLTKADLNLVKELTFDGGNEIYFYPYPLWDGETDDFDVHSLRDIVLCPNVEYLGIASMVTDGDLSPLSELKNLRVLELPYMPKFYNIEALLKLHNLEELVYFQDTIDSKYNNVLERLKERGVKIR